MLRTKNGYPFFMESGGLTPNMIACKTELSTDFPQTNLGFKGCWFYGTVDGIIRDDKLVEKNSKWARNYNYIMVDTF